LTASGAEPTLAQRDDALQVFALPEYIAYLANAAQIDNNFLSFEIKCEIIAFYSIGDRVPIGKLLTNSATEKYAKSDLVKGLPCSPQPH
jgi:hypothetical protein